MAKKKVVPTKVSKKRPPRKPPVPPPTYPPVGHPTGPDELSDDERRYVAEYLIDRVASAAYRRCYPHCSAITAQVAGPAIRRRPHVDAEIRAELAAQNLRCRVSADNVIRETARIAFSDINDLYCASTGLLYVPRQIPLNARRAIASIKVQREWVSVHRAGRVVTTTKVQEIEYKFWNKLDALQKLCTHLGLSTPITPLDALLQALPAALSMQVRHALLNPHTPPPLNGHTPPFDATPVPTSKER